MRIARRLPVEGTAAEIAAIERAVPAEAVTGARYDPHQMASLDSERAA